MLPLSWIRTAAALIFGFAAFVAVAANFSGISGGLTQDRCDDGGNAFWAQKRIAIDLMLEEVARDSAIRVVPKVAVVDSGFDISKLSYFGTPVRTERGYKEAADPQEDPSAHGTSVAGLIGGKDGLGGIPDAPLTVYRATSDELGSTGELQLSVSVDRACQEGAEIINLSWGGHMDESGTMSEEAWSTNLEKDLLGQTGSKKINPLHALVTESEIRELRHLEQLRQRGCIVVKSAGNDNYRINRRQDLDDAFLRVEASSVSSQLTEFSSNGELRAPGERIYALRSAQAIKTHEPKLCRKGDRDLQRINGTSFAAPLTAGVAAQVLSYLKNSPFSRSFPRTTAKDNYAYQAAKVSLVNRILKASEFEKDINGLRAVRIAKIARAKTKEEIGDKIDVAKLRGWLAEEMARDPFCHAGVTRCEGIKNADELNRCFNRLRKRLYLCEESMSESEIGAVTRAIIETAHSNGATELAIGHVVNRQSNPEIAKLAGEIWKIARNRLPDPKNSSYVSISDLTLTLGVIPSLERNQITDAFQLLLHPEHKTLEETFLNLGVNRGGEEFLALYTNMIREISFRFGTDFAVDLVKISVRTSDPKTGAPKLRKSLSALRMLGAILGAQPPIFSPRSREYEQIFGAERWFVQKLFADTSGESIESIELLKTIKGSWLRQDATLKDIAQILREQLRQDAQGKIQVSARAKERSIVPTWVLSLQPRATLDIDAVLVGILQGAYHYETTPQKKRESAYQLISESLTQLAGALRLRKEDAKFAFLKNKLRLITTTYAQSVNSPLRMLGMPAYFDDSRDSFQRLQGKTTVFDYDESRDIAQVILRKVSAEYPISIGAITKNYGPYYELATVYRRLVPYACMADQPEKFRATGAEFVRNVYAQTLKMCLAAWQENPKSEGVGYGKSLCQSLVGAIKQSACREVVDYEIIGSSDRIELLKVLNGKTRSEGQDYLLSLEMKNKLTP